MTDTVIKGSGNSRSLKTVPNALTLYPTHEALVAAMIDGTFPIDLGPLNDAGVQTRGMDLTKANLLSDATAALYGKGDNASPDEVLAAIKQLINAANNLANSKSWIVTGTYIGTGTYGADSPNVLRFSNPPKLLLLNEAAYDHYSYIVVYPEARTYSQGNFTSFPRIEVTWNQNTVSWFSNSSAVAQMNQNGGTYYYTAIG